MHVFQIRTGLESDCIQGLEVEFREVVENLLTELPSPSATPEPEPQPEVVEAVEAVEEVKTGTVEATSNHDQVRDRVF